MLRNKELRCFFLVYVLIACISIIIGFSINVSAGFLAVFSSAAFAVAAFLFYRVRYHRIARISDQIDLVLHNAEHLYISDCEEGELSILQDEIVKMTLRIREQNDQLLADKKLLADSLADVAHQLRTPLTSVNLILSLLEQMKEESERKRLLREVDELFMRMDWLLSSLLKISRLDAEIVNFVKEDVCLAELINASARPLLISMELHDIQLLNKTANSVRLSCDSGWLSEAFTNIFKNCMESLVDSGTIEVTCDDNTLFTEIVIHDSGKGFCQEDLPHLFDRFYRGKNSGATGYGIGLALCRMIVMRQGGTITSKNHPQGGAMFLIRFPKI